MAAQLLDVTLGTVFNAETRPVAVPAQPSPADLNAAVWQVLAQCAPGSTVSTRFAIEGLRHRLPELRIADEELVNVVADQAIARGLSVIFDSRES